MKPETAKMTALLLAVGLGGGLLLSVTGLPMPFLLGSLVATGAFAMLRPASFPARYGFPVRLRMLFVAIVGSLIGARVDSDFVAGIAGLWLSLLVITGFVALAHVWNFTIFRRLGGYDRATAFFCGAPGGLVESLELGEAAGADARILTLQQFLRVILVITLVPLGLSLLHGEALGSAGGMSLGRDTAGIGALPVLALVCAAGVALGRGLHLPAGHLTGPLAVSATLAASGLWSVDSPGWLFSLAQIVIGASLGSRFFGATGPLIRRALWLAILSVGGMVALAAGLAALSAQAVGQGFEVMLISLAPGGAIEMGLVALSLGVNPAFVTFHHLYRITLTVLEITLMSRWLGIVGARKATPGRDSRPR